MSVFYNPTPSSEAFLMHFNKNHDPKNGQFSTGHGGTSSKISVKQSKIWEARGDVKDPRIKKDLEKHKNDPYYVGSKAYNERNKKIEDWALNNGYTKDFVNYARKDSSGLGNVEDIEDYEMWYEDMTGKSARRSK